MTDTKSSNISLNGNVNINVNINFNSNIIINIDINININVKVPSTPRKGHSTPFLRPMSIVATVAHLSYC